MPFERPQSELQRAIQQRAQEALDRDRDLDREERRPKPLKWVTIFALACIPVLLTIVAVDGFLRVFHKVMETYTSEPAPQPQQAAPAETSSSSTPGVVMLQSYDTPSKSQDTPPPAAANPPPAADAQPQH
ncbi:MAG TPA: hypothetical protein VH814_25250 [Steroidobacteraceae bacterium]